MPRLPALCLLLTALSAASACHRVERSAPPRTEAVAPMPANEGGSKISLPQAPASRPTRSEALAMCEAYMGFEKNDCLDKVKQDYPQVVAMFAGATNAG